MTPSPTTSSQLADERRDNRIVAGLMSATVAVAALLLLYTH